LLEKYPNQVKLVFKNYPLKSHKYARKAAAAALAAHAQGRFWDFHDALFASYNKLNDVSVQEIQVRLELDKSTFDVQRQSPQVMDQIKRDIRWAREAGVRGTPSVFINGRLQRSRSLESFSAAVEAELRRLGK
jgi:protein-disulfide isomerase